MKRKTLNKSDLKKEFLKNIILIKRTIYMKRKTLNKSDPPLNTEQKLKYLEKKSKRERIVAILLLLLIFSTISFFLSQLLSKLVS